MIRFAGLAIFAVALFLTTGAFAQQADQPVLKGAAAFGDWRADRPGVRRLIKPEDLPKAYATKSASNGAGLVDRPKGAMPQLPPGFSAQLIASFASRRMATCSSLTARPTRSASTVSPRAVRRLSTQSSPTA